MNQGFTCKIKFDEAKLRPEKAAFYKAEYEAELDDIDSILGDICEILQDQEGVEFLVSGFGQDWPVDINTDLLVVLSQINHCINKIDMAQFEFCLDFYEQGIERRLKFNNFDENRVRIACESDTDWMPNPSEMLMDKHVVALELNKLKSDFVLLAEKVCSEITSHEWFYKWKNQKCRH